MGFDFSQLANKLHHWNITWIKDPFAIVNLLRIFFVFPLVVIIKSYWTLQKYSSYMFRSSIKDCNLIVQVVDTTSLVALKVSYLVVFGLWITPLDSAVIRRGCKTNDVYQRSTPQKQYQVNGLNWFYPSNAIS